MGYARKSFVWKTSVAIEKGSCGIKDSVRIEFKVDQFEKKKNIFILKKNEELLDDFHEMQRIDFENLYWSLRDEIVSNSSDDEADVNLESLKMEGSKDQQIVKKRKTRNLCSVI